MTRSVSEFVWSERIVEKLEKKRERVRSPRNREFWRPHVQMFHASTRSIQSARCGMEGSRGLADTDYGNASFRPTNWSEDTCRNPIRSLIGRKGDGMMVDGRRRRRRRREEAKEGRHRVRKDRNNSSPNHLTLYDQLPLETRSRNSTKLHDPSMGRLSILYRLSKHPAT